MNKRAEKVFFYLHQLVFIIYCQIGLEFYTERAADRVEEQVSIFHVLDDGVSSVSTIVFPESGMIGLNTDNDRPCTVLQPVHRCNRLVSGSV